MCDSDDGEDSQGAVDLTGFLFGNIDESGQLEDDSLLDGDSMRMLSSLGRLGLGSLLSEVLAPGEEVDDYGDRDYNEKSPSAVDYSDISELADEQPDSEIRSNVIQHGGSLPSSSEFGTDDGYEGDMECDTDLMPPPPVPERSEADKKAAKKLETPLAAMLPSKYADTDVTELFPDFRPDKVLRFSRLFGPGKASSLPQIWRGVKKRRRRKRSDSGDSDPPVLPADQAGGIEYESDDEEKFLRPIEETGQNVSDSPSGNNSTQKPSTALWRFGPAQIWYDMMKVPESGEGFNYGFKVKAPTDDDADSVDSGFPDEAFLMVSQLQWEDDVIWDGNEIKHKVMARLNSKTNAAGWLPTSVNRTAQQFSHPTRAPPPIAKPAPVPVSTNNSTTNPGGGTGDDDTWYSIFPVENEELVYGTWEDEVIWDPEAMKDIPEPKILTLDPNDENIVLGIPDDVDPSKIVRERGPQPKVKIPHPHVKKSKLLLGKAGVINVLQEDAPPPPPKSPDRDPFNISNDVYYTAKTSTLRLKVGGGQIIQHSTPVVELRAPFIQTHMGPAKLRAFHRPAMRKFSSGPLAPPTPHAVLPLIKHIRKKAKQRESERLASGGGDVFFMRSAEDLTGRDGDIVLVEFCEEHPPLISQVGMCSKIKIYYKRCAGKDNGPKPHKYGEVAYAHTSPFLGILPPGQSQQVIENNMYRAPIYEHTLPQTDFLVIRSRQGYFIRAVDALFAAGQECPLYEVPGPNSKRANNFVRDFLQVFIYRLFWKSRDSPRRIRMDDIKRAFPSHSESSIRKRLKLCADFKRTGLDSNWWVIKPEFRLPSEEEIRSMVSPEQCCAYFSMVAAEQRLKDAGYGEKFLFTQHEDDDEEMQLKMDDEVKVAPWNTTRAYIQAMRGKCLLQLTGPADPTGCGEGFSYVRVPNKPQQTREEAEQQPKRTVTGTDADLRRLSLNNAKALLRKFGVPEEEIKKLSRWEVIDVVRTLSTEKAKAGEEGMTKFSRGNRFSIAEHQERYKEECQRIFELQNRVLSSTEVLSTDEAESSVSEESDLEEMGKNLENMLANKKTTEQLSLEREEAERAELRKMIMGESEKKPQRDDMQSQSSQGRILRIVRTFRNPSGSVYTRVEYVRKPAVIEAYTKIRSTKDTAFIRQFATLDEAQKEEMKREKRRIQEQLRRIKRNQERDRLAGSGGTPGAFHSLGNSMSNSSMNNFNSPSMMGISSTSGMTDNVMMGNIKQEDSDTPRKRRHKLKPDLKLKCGACGQVGHMRTNKACPLYTGSMGGGEGRSSNSQSMVLTEEQEIEEMEREMLEDEELLNVEGTKLTLSSKLVKHAEELKRRANLPKTPRDSTRGSGSRRGGPGHRRTGHKDDSCDYLVRRPAARRRTDPLVTLSSLLEDVLNDMRHLPDVQPFLFPVNAKLVPDYYRIVSRPMDLQTIRDNLRLKHYQSREEFLADVNQIVENSTLYNGGKSSLTVAAQRMLQRCVERLADKEEQLMKLEKAINPLLDDNDQVALSFILDNLLTTKLKIMPEAWPFLKPVNKKQVKDYYSVIKKPIDLETMGKKIQAHKYHSRSEFMADIELLLQNCLAYNGPTSCFTRQADAVLAVTREALFAAEFGEHVSQLEANIARVQEKMRSEALTAREGEVEGEGSSAEDEMEGELGGVGTNSVVGRGDTPDSKRARGRPRKHKLSASGDAHSEGDPIAFPGVFPGPSTQKRSRGRPRKQQHSLEDDLQYSGSESSEFEEVDPGTHVDAAEGLVQLASTSSTPFYPNPDVSTMEIEPTYDPSDFLIKREMMCEDDAPPPQQMPAELTIDVPLYNPTQPEPYPYQDTAFKEEDLVEAEGELETLQPVDMKLENEETPTPWHHVEQERAIHDDLQVTDSEEENEDGLWF